MIDRSREPSADPPPPLIVTLNATDHAGGAEAMAWALANAAEQAGYRTRFVAGVRHGDDPRCVATPRSPWWRTWHGLAQRVSTIAPLRIAAKALAEPARVWHATRGSEHFGHPWTPRLDELVGQRPALVHAHNLHGDYFDLRALPALTRETPWLVTLHDAWLLAGHCCHSLECERWRDGCGACPHLDLPMRKLRDRTAANWRVKREIYRRSRLAIACPSQWIMDRAKDSILAGAVTEARLIANGVDTEVFSPGPSTDARARLDLPGEGACLLFAATTPANNPWKDFATLEAALERLGSGPSGPLAVALGQRGADRTYGSTRLVFRPYETDPARLADYYRAADLYVHPARAETFGLVVAEAMACGRAVIATNIGGLAEQVVHGETGLLVEPGDAAGLADAVGALLADPARREAMGGAARDRARERFDARDQRRRYVDWYSELIDGSADATRLTARRPPPATASPG
ncbi:MAG: glycosyltransferase [Planctomycetes bacterium]|nr:glycosyltransferase [Planctomycetota bacterium]